MERRGYKQGLEHRGSEKEGAELEGSKAPLFIVPTGPRPRNFELSGLSNCRFRKRPFSLSRRVRGQGTQGPTGTAAQTEAGGRSSQATETQTDGRDRDRRPADGDRGMPPGDRGVAALSRLGPWFRALTRRGCGLRLDGAATAVAAWSRRDRLFCSVVCCGCCTVSAFLLIHLCKIVDISHPMAHARTRARAHTRTKRTHGVRARARTHTRTHARRLTRSHAHTNVHIRACARAHAPTHAQARTRKHARTHAQNCTCTHTRVCARTHASVVCARVCACVYVQTARPGRQWTPPPPFPLSILCLSISCKTESLEFPI